MDQTTKITNKVLRKRKNSMIATIVSLTIVGLLILTTILLAVIPINTGVRYESSPDSIHLQLGNEHYYLFKDDEATRDDYNKVWNAYLSACNPSVISTIFGGYAGRGMTAEHSTLTTPFSSLENDDTAFVVIFYWSERQTMVNANGSTFTYMAGNTEVTTPTTFFKAHFNVTNQNAVQDSRVLLRTADTQSGTQFSYTGVANYYGLYNILNQMVEDDKFVPGS